MKPITIEVNGSPRGALIEPRMHLADFLRDECRLTGTHIGCEHGVCGACTVLIDDRPARSCITFAVACDGGRVTTVEGYDHDPVMRRLRAAFTAHHALQCGYCTPGMLATARDIVLRLPDADEARIRLELAGNLCRCTGYMGIVAAIGSVLAQYREAPDAAIDALRAATVGPRPARPLAVSPTGPIAGKAVPDRSLAVPAAPPGTVAAAATVPVATTSTAAAPADAVPGGRTTINGDFELAHPLPEVWRFMSDLPAVAACLPGAQLTGQQGDRLEGRVAIKFGPIRADFAGQASLERNDAEHRAVLRGSGQDAASQSRTQGDVVYTLSAPAPQRTRVDVVLHYALQGPLAQFSRSGLVRDFVARLIAEFGRNVGRALDARAQGSTAAVPASSSLPAGRMLWAVLVARLRRWFGGHR